jgi:hypothetical protein
MLSASLGRKTQIKLFPLQVSAQVMLVLQRALQSVSVLILSRPNIELGPLNLLGFPFSLAKMDFLAQASRDVSSTPPKHQGIP